MGAVATEDGVDVSQHLGVFAGARMPTPEIQFGHKKWAATRPPTAKTTHPLLHTQDLFKERPQPTKRVYPKKPTSEKIIRTAGRLYT